MVHVQKKMLVSHVLKGVWFRRGNDTWMKIKNEKSLKFKIVVDEVEALFKSGAEYFQGNQRRTIVYSLIADIQTSFIANYRYLLN